MQGTALLFSEVPPRFSRNRSGCYRASNFDTGEQTQARWLYSSCTAVDPIAERRIEVRFGCFDSTSAKMAAPRIGLESERSFQLINVKGIQRASDVWSAQTSQVQLLFMAQRQLIRLLAHFGQATI